ncbi:MAG: NADH-quinone oxidoreductase subunit L, partial [Actinomycetota bacterium]|nr:NADH-quinone oxidoreductase subunit L [Actinomycetota bacterium]
MSHAIAAAPERYVDASGLLSTSWLLLALPLVGAAVLLLVGKRGDRWGHLLGCATVGVSFVLGLAYFFA